MNIEIRGLRSEGEWADGLVLWEKVFEVGPWLFHSLHRSAPYRDLDDCSVAVVDGEIVAAVDVFFRDVYDSEGMLRRMGGIGSVATLPEYRKQGLSGRLLERALEVMEKKGAEWSLLFTGVNSHYARYGWFDTPTLRWDVRIPVGLPNPRPEWAISETRYLRLEDILSLRPAHEAFNAGRPLTTHRTETMWKVAVRERFNRPDWVCLTATRGDRLAFLAAQIGSEWFEVRELKGDEEGLQALLSHVAALAHAKGADAGGFQIPADLVPLVESVFGPAVAKPQPYAMSRPIADRMSRDEIEAMFASPASVHYGGDDF
ncbi:MAG: GNAT family N-acetyltransferase [Fimbriimonadaceae bacterium]|nr:GNAT family N-acetyltransferase [Fimbriimonadaceae bacterium]